eukprot:scaffold15757_cov54-Attheya_sp.AAC.3
MTRLGDITLTLVLVVIAKVSSQVSAFSVGGSLLVATSRRIAIPELLSRQSRSVHVQVPVRFQGTTTRWLTSSLQQQEPVAASAIENPPRVEAAEVVFLVPSTGADVIPSKFGIRSPVDPPSIAEAVEHLARKVNWFSDGKISAQVVPIPQDAVSVPSILDAGVVIALGLTDASDLKAASDLFQARRERNAGTKCHFALDCSQDMDPMVGPFDASSVSLNANLFPWTQAASGMRMRPLMEGDEVDWVKHSVDATWEKGPVRNAKELFAMATQCGDCIGNCVKDEQCNKCLNELTKVDTRDQVLSYRTIVSYESDLLREFSFCILQKHNIFGCNAEIPALPVVQPITTWRGETLTKRTARDILIAHLDDEAAPEGSRKSEVSWKVSAGANVAYDQFPSQNQIFYESVNGRDMWYDPVFRVETVDGRNVWAKRHYKVRDGPTPGSFRFSVLDNGVTSNEFWNIAGVADDLSWCVFHYAGAAGSVGQRYLGGLLCTPDGSLPPMDQWDEIWKALRSVGIQPWELFVVDNDPKSEDYIDAGPPPLDYFRKDVLEAKARKAAKE